MIGDIKSLVTSFGLKKGLVTIEISGDENYNELLRLQSENKHVEIKEHKNTRSLDANAYFHVLVHKIASTLNKGEDEINTYLNLEYGEIARDKEGNIAGCKVPKNVDITMFYKYAKWYKQDEDETDCYIFYKPTHELNSKEFARLLDGTIYECKELGIETLSEEQIKSLMRNYNGKMEEN